MTLKNFVSLFVLLFARTLFIAAQNLSLDCGSVSPKTESGLMRQTPQGAKRIDKRHLTVHWLSGTTEFIDQPPYDEPFNGVRYLYCGFNPSLDAHLISKSDNGVFTGVLLDNRTVKKTPAGLYVMFSDDKYFSSVQPDGLNGQEWYVYSKEGELIWKGLSGISALTEHQKDNWTYFIATLTDPRWNDSNELQSTHRCASGPAEDRIVTLTQTDNEWL